MLGGGDPTISHFNPEVIPINPEVVEVATSGFVIFLIGLFRMHARVE